MANICSNVVVFYPDNSSPVSAVSYMKAALLHCYPSAGVCKDTGIHLICEYLNIPTKGISLRGDIIYMDIQDEFIRLELDTAWCPLYDAYTLIADHFGLHFVLQAEEPGAGIFINTDIYGWYLNDRYRIQLQHDMDASGTPYEELFKRENNTDFYFSSEKDLLKWLSEYGINSQNIEGLEDMLETDYIRLDIYDQE
jgi:hypothetical protein